MPDLLPLEMLPNGQWADVDSVCGEPSWVGRLAELGVRIGGQPSAGAATRRTVFAAGGRFRLSLRSPTQILVRPLIAAAN